MHWAHCCWQLIDVRKVETSTPHLQMILNVTEWLYIINVSHCSQYPLNYCSGNRLSTTIIYILLPFKQLCSIHQFVEYDSTQIVPSSPKLCKLSSTCYWIEMILLWLIVLTGHHNMMYAPPPLPPTIDPRLFFRGNPPAYVARTGDAGPPAWFAYIDVWFICLYFMNGAVWSFSCLLASSSVYIDATPPSRFRWIQTRIPRNGFGFCLTGVCVSLVLLHIS